MKSQKTRTDAIRRHWDRKKLKYVANLKSGEAITSDSIAESGEYPVFGGNGIRGYTSAYTHSGMYVLIGRQGALCGNINYASGRFWASEHAVVVDPQNRGDVRWLGELLRHMNQNQYSASAAQPGLAVDAIANLEIPVPPFREQQIIGGFLENETARLDALVAAKERLLGLLAEKRRALITRAVTRGLDPRVPLRDSGIPWLGKIPTHWMTPPVYARFDVQLGKMLDAKTIRGTHLAPYLRNVDVQWGTINALSLPEMDFDEQDRQKYSLGLGDILVCEGGEIGRSALWHGEVKECYYQKALHRLRPLKDADQPEFFIMVMRALVELGVFESEASVATIQHLPAEELRVLRYPSPPLAEQRAIVAHITAETATLDALRTATERTIALLKERRAALIAGAVTGQIDVSEVSAGSNSSTPVQSG